MVADAGDPAINYVLLGTAGSAGSPRMADNRPSALRK
jgi:hypothetical protein